jgi:uncharacterized membrane protein
MSDLIVVTFDDLEGARAAMSEIRRLEAENVIELEDTAIVERSADGAVHVKNELTGATETGAVIGALAGAILLFFFPVAGLAIGAAAGAAIGSLFQTGVEPKFVDDVKAQLSPGHSALFLVVRKAAADAITAAMRPFKGEVLQTTLPSDAEAELREALEV